MRKFLLSLLCFFFIFTLTGGMAVFLTACGAQSEGGNGGGISDPENPEDGEITENPDDDVEGDSFNLNFKIYAVMYTSWSTYYACNTSIGGASDRGSGVGPYFNMDIYSVNKGSSSWGHHDTLDVRTSAYGRTSASNSSWTGQYCSYTYGEWSSTSSRETKYFYSYISANAGNYAKFAGYSMNNAKNSGFDYTGSSVYVAYRDTNSSTYSAGWKFLPSRSDVVDKWACSASLSGTVYVNFKKKYAYRYFPNGGSGPASGSSDIYYAGDDTTLRPAITRTGYTFNGWSTSSGASSGNSAGSTYSTNCASDQAFYATWRATTYTITLDQNSATTNGTTSVYVTYNTWPGGFSITNPQRTGYTFDGWTTTRNGSTVLINAGGSLQGVSGYTDGGVWSKAGDTTVYAKWTINQYYINISILDPGGGEPCDGTAGTMTVYYSDTGQTYNGCGDQPKAHVSYNSTIRISNISPGVGMHLSSVSSSSGRGSWNGSTFTFTVAAADDSIIIYMAYNTYTITYNPNGGSGSSQTQTVTYKSSFTTKPSNTFSKTSYTFTGWGGSYPSANASYTYNTVGNTTLYAQWSANTATQKLYQMYATGTGASPSYTMGGSGGNMYMSFHYDNNGTATAVREKQFGAGPNSQVFLTGYSRTITAEAYTPGQYIFMGLTTTNTPPTGLNPPTTNSITVSGTDTTTVYAWYRQVPNSAAIIKWGAEIGYYFESGEFPQSYLGTSVSGLGSVSYNIPYLNANGSTVNIPVYSYSGGKCALVSGKYFKVEPIKWKVNDAVWGMYGAYNTNITAVTAEVIGFGAVAPSSAGKEGWAWTSSGMYSNTNTTAGRMSLTNANNTSVSYDKFNAAGTQTIVASNAANSDASQLRVAGLSEIKAATGSSSAGAGWAAKCSDFVAFMTTGSTTGGVYADYWTRNLAGDTFKGYHQNGLSITASGYESSKYLSYAQGVRYAMTLSSGRNMGGTAARYLRVYSNGSDKNEGNHISYLSVETADAGDILLIDAPAGVGANSLISWGNIYPAGALSYFDVGTETILDIGKEVQILSVTLRRYYSDGRHYYRSKVEGSLTNGDDWFVIHNSHNEGSYGNDITANTYAETSSGRKFAVNQGLFNADDWMSYINYCDATKESNQNFKQYMWKDLDDSFWWGGETVYNQNTAVYYDYHVTLKPGLYRMSYHGMSTRSDGNTTTCVRPVGEASFNGEWYVYKGKTEYSYTFTVGSGFVGFQGGYWYGDWTNFKNIRLEFVAETSNKNFALNTNFSTFNTGFTPGWDTSLNRLPYDTHNWGMANMGVPNSATGYHAHLAYDTDKGGYVVELVNKSPSLGRWIGTSQWFDAGILQPGRTYTIQLDARKVGSGSPHLTGGLYYDINGAYAFHNNYYDFVLTEEWQTYTYTFTTSTSMDASKSAYLYVYGMEGGEGTSWIDNVYIYES